MLHRLPTSPIPQKMSIKPFIKKGLKYYALLTGLICLMLLSGGFLLFALSLPSVPTQNIDKADLIVVLTGGRGRLKTGLDLLNKRAGKKLFISGVGKGVNISTLIELSDTSSDYVNCCIILGYDATNTQENAYETANWITAQGYKSLRLVTSSYHMPRAILEFQIVMPHIDIIPHPVFSPSVRNKDWWMSLGSTQLVFSEYLKFILTNLRDHLSHSPLDSM